MSDVFLRAAAVVDCTVGVAGECAAIKLIRPFGAAFEHGLRPIAELVVRSIQHAVAAKFCRFCHALAVIDRAVAVIALHIARRVERRLPSRTRRDVVSERRTVAVLAGRIDAAITAIGLENAVRDIDFARRETFDVRARFIRIAVDRTIAAFRKHRSVALFTAGIDHAVTAVSRRRTSINIEFALVGTGKCPHRTFAHDFGAGIFRGKERRFLGICVVIAFFALGVIDGAVAAEFDTFADIDRAVRRAFHRAAARIQIAVVTRT